MERSRYKKTGMVVISGRNPTVPKFRSVADERLSKALKKAINRETAPPDLEARVRSIFCGTDEAL
ncbi:MAG: hypothetical protein DWQ47_10180 [Acidobacteria bacterium]|nr:MAG: hypothetical protein DWQ32_12595 [Acidobacteriota bacterium]REJ97958.1 MAG: hypothetical protein DWQ38_15395 [Acidobacteriota bacterium]REK16701.1 MAG: hypothetical protein DWQ43_00440 [Acidobacteriota bacterium]REK42612.1 MAG: hypothetical protein DWQ47_10180 [Acidobacteriota bacterium]